MKKYIVMGNYTAKAFQGFMKDPKQDSSIAVKALTEAVGGTFEQVSASGMVAVSSGAVSDFSVHEVVNLNAVAKIANKTASGYKEPGK